MSDHRFDDKTVLITGAGSGIGRETAHVFARAGADLVLCDVNTEGLAETESGCRGRVVLSSVVDVADRGAMRQFAAAVHERTEALDVLVNNAGVGMAARFLDTSLDDWEWILGINLRGVIHGCYFFVPKMVERGAGGHVVNLSSVLGYFAADISSAYATTKFGVFGLSEALRLELEPHDIGVSTICPGIINTSITSTMRMRGDRATANDRSKINNFYKRRNYGPEKVAEAIFAAVVSNRSVVPVSPEAWVLYWLKRLAPATGPKIMKRIAAIATGDDR